MQAYLASIAFMDARQPAERHNRAADPQFAKLRAEAEALLRRQFPVVKHGAERERRAVARK